MTLPTWPEGPADALERELLATWAAEGLFQRTVEAGRDGPPFVFFEGPPTANGRPGIHHVFARTVKDLVCRFHAMQGKRVTRIAAISVPADAEPSFNRNARPFCAAMSLSPGFQMTEGR